MAKAKTFNHAKFVNTVLPTGKKYRHWYVAPNGDGKFTRVSSTEAAKVLKEKGLDTKQLAAALAEARADNYTDTRTTKSGKVEFVS